MKGHRIRFLSVIATFMLISSILSSQALAVARSSKYLDAYGTYVSPVGNGKIVITIDVDRGQIVEYSTVDSEISIEHEIVIEGIYYDSSLNYDSFQGTFYISDIGGIEKNRNNAHFNFNPKYRYCPEFQNDYGEPISSNIAQILFDKNFSTLAVQLEGIDGDSRFLVLNASNREDALSQYAYLLDAKELKF